MSIFNSLNVGGSSIVASLYHKNIINFIHEALQKSHSWDVKSTLLVALNTLLKKCSHSYECLYQLYSHNSISSYIFTSKKYQHAVNEEHSSTVFQCLMDMAIKEKNI